MKKLILCFVALGIISNAFAQFSSSSPYSVYGPGLVSRSYTSLNRANGYSGVAIQDGLSLNGLNPAANVWITAPLTHMYEVGTFVEGNSYRTTERYEHSVTGGLNNLNYWFRLKDWWTMTASVTPFSTVSYHITGNKMLATSQESAYTYEGVGNITQLALGNSFKVYKNLSAGINLSYIFGSVNRSESISASSTTGSLTLNNKMHTNKFKADYGVQYKINLAAKRSITFGATYENSLTLKGKNDITLMNGDYDTLTSEERDGIRYSLPSRIGGGISFQTKRSRIITDLIYEPWSSASYPGIMSQSIDTWRYSVGYSYLGNPDAQNYLGAIKLSTGIYYQQYPIKIDGQVLPNYGITVGLGLPVLDGKSTINLIYGYDRFGAADGNLILQRTQKVMLDIVIRDIWGYKRAFD